MLNLSIFIPVPVFRFLQVLPLNRFIDRNPDSWGKSTPVEPLLAGYTAFCRYRQNKQY
jgi:hypothetical protein